MSAHRPGPGGHAQPASAPGEGAPRPLSLQLYTLREPMAADAQATWELIADLGIDFVEPHRFVEPADRDGLAARLRATGLSAPSAHARFLGLDDERVFKAAASLGIGTVIQPTTEPERWAHREGVAELARALNEAARRAAEEGVRVGYHNHAFEYEHLDRPLDRLAELLDEEVVLEVDTYWAAVGGDDPVGVLERLGHAAQLMHVKDGPIVADPYAQVPLGRGRMPIMEILRAAPHALAVVEMDACAGDVSAAVRQCVDYLRGQ